MRRTQPVLPTRDSFCGRRKRRPYTDKFGFIHFSKTRLESLEDQGLDVGHFLSRLLYKIRHWNQSLTIFVYILFIE